MVEKQERNRFYEKYTKLGENAFYLVVEIQILIFTIGIQNSIIMWVGGITNILFCNCSLIFK